MVIHRGKYVCFLSVLPVAVTHTQTHTLTPFVSHLFLLRVCVSCIMQVYFKQTRTLKHVRDSYTNENVGCVCVRVNHMCISLHM